ncbi:MAG: hypothetical protein MK198_15045 [Gracilimonas sp.]|uniref:hypothetical protein n=1 Tax=Gracilimonas sp. TaxID=1974203 RepID=UPI003752E4CC|nr:hypothetical protein [Gracilimonas sp.]
MKYQEMNIVVRELTETERINIYGGEQTAPSDDTSFWYDAAYYFTVGFKISLFGKTATAMA